LEQGFLRDTTTFVQTQQLHLVVPRYCIEHCNDHTRQRVGSGMGWFQASLVYCRKKRPIDPLTLFQYWIRLTFFFLFFFSSINLYI
jgi:hypothetical protein